MVKNSKTPGDACSEELDATIRGKSGTERTYCVKVPIQTAVVDELLKRKFSLESDNRSSYVRWFTPRAEFSWRARKLERIKSRDVLCQLDEIIKYVREKESHEQS